MYNGYIKKSVRIGLIFILFSLNLQAQSAMKLHMWVNRIELDTVGADCSYQPVLIAMDNDRLGIKTNRDTIVLARREVFSNGFVLGYDEFHNMETFYSHIINKDGLLIFITQIDGKNRFGLVLSTLPCENKDN